MERKTLSTKRIVITALMAALTVAGSSMRVVLPLEIAGNASFHLGNIMCALSGLLLGPWLGGLAAGLGSAIYDLMDARFIQDVGITLLTKFAYGLFPGLVVLLFRKKDWGYVIAVIGSAAGAIAYAALYLAKTYFYSGMLIHGLTPDAAWLTVLGKLPATIFNAAVAVIFAPILGVAIRTALKKSHMTLE